MAAAAAAADATDAAAAAAAEQEKRTSKIPSTRATLEVRKALRAQSALTHATCRSCDMATWTWRTSGHGAVGSWGVGHKIMQV